MISKTPTCAKNGSLIFAMSILNYKSHEGNSHCYVPATLTKLIVQIISKRKTVQVIIL